MNTIVLLGRLVRDVVFSYSSSEEPIAIAKYTLAVKRLHKTEGKKDVDFINIVAFGKRAEFAEKYFTKGQRILVTGRLQTGTYEKEDGNKQYFAEVIVSEQQFADGMRVLKLKE